MDFWTPLLDLGFEIPRDLQAGGLELREPLGCISQPSSDRWLVSRRRRLTDLDINLPQFSSARLVFC